MLSNKLKYENKRNDFNKAQIEDTAMRLIL